MNDLHRGKHKYILRGVEPNQDQEKSREYSQGSHQGGSRIHNRSF